MITEYERSEALAGLVATPLLDLNDISMSEQSAVDRAAAMLEKARLLVKRLELFQKAYGDKIA